MNDNDDLDYQNYFLGEYKHDLINIEIYEVLQYRIYILSAKSI